MKVEDFDYNLPEELIAQTPLKVRDSSRLLVLNKKNLVRRFLFLKYQLILQIYMFIFR